MPCCCCEQDLLPGGLRAEQDANDPFRVPGAKWQLLSTGWVLLWDAGCGTNPGCCMYHSGTGCSVPQSGLSLEQLGIARRLTHAGTPIRKTSQVTNCSAGHLGGCQCPPGKPPGAPGWPATLSMARERVLQGGYPVLPCKALSDT